MTSDVAALPPMTNLRDRLRVYPEPFSQILGTQMWVRPDETYVVWGELLLAVPTPTYHVKTVVGLSSTQQVSRVTAWRVVTGVSYQQTLGNRSDPVEPRQTVCVLNLACTATYDQAPMPCTDVPTPGPLPTVIGSSERDLGKEPMHDGRSE